MMTDRKRCGVTIEGHRYASGVVLWRRSCRNSPMIGFDHCRHHLTAEEWAVRRATIETAVRR